MLYKKNIEKELDRNLFMYPTAEYRGTPFWAWNCELNEGLLERQIKYLKEMGFGGFHMHSRSGMATDYLSEDFMKLVKFCCDKAKKEDMLAWLYDEDRFPSGAAGGFVTKTIKYRMRHLIFTEKKMENTGSRDEGYENGVPCLLACYDIILDKNNKLADYRVIGENDTAEGRKIYAYITTEKPSGWFNNQTYLDTMNPEAVDEFIRITHEEYKKNVGNEFGKTIPAIFTDEPRKNVLSDSGSSDDAVMAWTYGFEDKFREKYGEDLILHLPEIYYDLSDDKISQYRYRYHDLSTDMFVDAFCDKYGEWCEKNGIALTGHVYWEPELGSQTICVGEAMRTYRKFTIPGIDMLCNWRELNTAKQVQSIVHQYGREAMMSELYGVTGWEFDFRGHKYQGDWQAALGVTVRVPHLSLVSMKGSAKRDYPASINYQSPWYKKYSYIEDHFARLNTVLTRGKPIVNIGVIHPIESYWLCYGPGDTCSDMKEKLENNHARLTEILLGGYMDFDFISEALLPEQCGEITAKLCVGEMNYSVIIVPGCITLRKTTVDILEKFSNAGGKLIFIGDCPKYIDATEDASVKNIYNNAVVIPFDEFAILNELGDEAPVEITTMKSTQEFLNNTGSRMKNYLINYRQDGDVRWLFIAHKEQSDKLDSMTGESLKIVLKGEYDVELYDTLNAKTEKIPCVIENGKTVIYREVYASDSLLLKLTSPSGKDFTCENVEAKISKIIDFKDKVSYRREEDNVYILDMAKYRLDDGELNEKEEILRIDVACRKILNYPMADGNEEQPWVLGKDKIEHYVTLYFDVECLCDITGANIAMEEVEMLKLNGESVTLEANGYFVDESIIKYPLPKLKKGMNTIEMKVPISKRTSVENSFIIGDFDVEMHGNYVVIKGKNNKIRFGSITEQGMPFYGGNIIYSAEIDTPECSLNIRCNSYRGALVSVIIDGKEAGNIAFSPYILKIGGIEAGKHKVEFVCYGNRHNTFGWLHNCGYNTWYGPDMWYAKDGEFCYEYNVKDVGILTSPVIEIVSDNMGAI